MACTYLPGYVSVLTYIIYDILPTDTVRTQKGRLHGKDVYLLAPVIIDVCSFVLIGIPTGSFLVLFAVFVYLNMEDKKIFMTLFMPFES